MRKLIVAMTLGAAFVAGPAGASTTVGGISFDDNAFADSLISSSGAFITSGGTLASVLTDINEATYASSSNGAYVELGFTDNAVVNGGGIADLILFDLGPVNVSRYFSVTIGGSTNGYLVGDTGFDVGSFDLSAAYVDLSDFGIAPGAAVTSVIVGFPATSDPLYLSLVGARNSISIPEPATLALFGLGLAGIGAVRRRKPA